MSSFLNWSLSFDIFITSTFIGEIIIFFHFEKLTNLEYFPKFEVKIGFLYLKYFSSNLLVWHVMLGVMLLLKHLLLKQLEMIMRNYFAVSYWIIFPFINLILGHFLTPFDLFLLKICYFLMLIWWFNASIDTIEAIKPLYYCFNCTPQTMIDVCSLISV